MKGRIFDVQRFSIHDGPGIRTTVFLKGCPLRCGWCQNPEGVSPERELSFSSARCIGCGRCVQTCPNGAHRSVEGGRVLERGRCTACGACADECPSGALEIVGRDVAAAEVIDEVLRDAPFYETSGGGVTLSGGEPTMQIDFAERLLRLAKAAGLDTCLDTCGQCDYGRLERLRPLVDLFLYDFKESDPGRHAAATGVSGERIVSNLRRLCADGAAVLLRCPVVPGANDRDDHFEAIASLARELPGLLGVELMPYHGLGEGKIERLGLDRSRRTRAARPSRETVDAWHARLAGLGVTPVRTG